MAGTVKVDTVQSSASGVPPVFKDSGGVEMGQLARAWVNFNGTSGAAVRGSFNVSSVTRNSTGNYSVAFTNALADTNFAACLTKQNASTQVNTACAEDVAARTASSIVISTIENAAAADSANINAVIFR